MRIISDFNTDTDIFHVAFSYIGLRDWKQVISPTILSSLSGIVMLRYSQLTANYLG